ncbi:UmuC domain-containing protein [Vibrio chagasii]|nr:UmuC domain-containing protein [Vibrio chagasii]
MFCLIDGSRFYASASTVMHPQYRDKPVLVASGADGISIAASRACSDNGIPKFSPIFQVKDKLALHGGVVFKANFNTLGHLSHRMMKSILVNIGSELPHYQYSVDEMFIDVSKLKTMGVDLGAHLYHVRKRVYQETRVGTGGGIGRTLTLAKVASFAGKKLSGYKGQCIMDTIVHENEVLKQMPVGEVWNVGRKLTEHFKHKGITTAHHLKLCDPDKMRKEFSVNVSNTIYELNGLPVLNFSDKQPAKKQMFSTGSYRERIKSPEHLGALLSNHGVEVCKKAREQGSDIRELIIFTATSPYEKCTPFSRSICHSFEPPTSDTAIVLSAIRESLSSLIPNNPLQQPLYKIGVGATKLTSNEMKQYDMFNVSKDNPKLMSAVDCLNMRFGKGAIKFGSQTLNANQSALGNVEIIELANYLTNIREIPIIKCK